MSRERHERELRQSLEEVETALETPLVSGELSAWASEVCDALEKLEPQLSRQIDVLHPEEYAAIGDCEPGLLNRVELLREQDQKNRAEFEDLQRRADRLAKRGELLEPDEGRIQDKMTELVDQGVAFVVRVRKQETEITTWLLEALERDQGTAD